MSLGDLVTVTGHGIAHEVRVSRKFALFTFDTPKAIGDCDITTFQEGKTDQTGMRPTRVGEMCDEPRSCDKAIGWRWNVTGSWADAHMAL